MTWYVVDGMDGVGKSTVARILADTLRSEGRTVSVSHHPNRDTRLGRVSRNFLLKRGSAAMVLASGFYFLDLLSSITKMKMSQKDTDDCIFVRYTLSVCYLPDRIFMKLFKLLCFCLPEPDMCILVDADADTAMERIGSRGEELEMFEYTEKLAKVRRNMLSVADLKGWNVFLNDGPVEQAEGFIRSVLSE